jgi:hypothetical protein
MHSADNNRMVEITYLSAAVQVEHNGINTTSRLKRVAHLLRVEPELGLDLLQVRRAQGSPVHAVRARLAAAVPDHRADLQCGRRGDSDR